MNGRWLSRARGDCARRPNDVEQREVPELVHLALRELGPVRVTSFLPILVERNILGRVRP